MTSSLKTALTEINVVKKHGALVNDPTRYKVINEAYSLPKNRKGDLPYDEAMPSHGIPLCTVRKFRQRAFNIR